MPTYATRLIDHRDYRTHTFITESPDEYEAAVELDRQVRHGLRIGLADTELIETVEIPSLGERVRFNDCPATVVAHYDCGPYPDSDVVFDHTRLPVTVPSSSLHPIK